MADSAAPAKKVAKAKKPKKVATHPTYSVMILAAVKALKDRKGSSRQAILKYVVANYKLDQKKATTQVRMSLKRMVENKSLKSVKGAGASGTFRLNEEAKPAKSPKKKTAAKKAKKPAGDKPKTPKKAKKPKTPKKPKAAKPKAAKPKKSPKKKATKAKKPAAKKAAKK